MEVPREKVYSYFLFSHISRPLSIALLLRRNAYDDSKLRQRT